MKVCKIAGCGRKIEARGWCRKHYKRWWQHGDPLAGRTPDGEILRFLENHRDYEGDECLIWPYGKNGRGYGQAWKDGRNRSAHVLMLEMTAGPKPTPEHQAAHSCGQGHKGCVAPNHLRWATPYENQMDRLEHGTHCRGERHWKGKLTETQVIEIRELVEEGVSPRKIGRLYGVSKANIYAIKIGKTWAWLEDKAAPHDSHSP